jgi:hypothetical protein
LRTYKHYDDVKAVDGISFEVQEGEIFGFLGPNGAGKTTTMTELEARLDPARFFRACRSAIVNLDRVQEIIPWFKGGRILRLTTGAEVDLSRAQGLCLIPPPEKVRGKGTLSQLRPADQRAGFLDRQAGFEHLIKQPDPGSPDVGHEQDPVRREHPLYLVQHGDGVLHDVQHLQVDNGVKRVVIVRDLLHICLLECDAPAQTGGLGRLDGQVQQCLRQVDAHDLTPRQRLRQHNGRRSEATTGVEDPDSFETAQR